MFILQMDMRLKCSFYVNSDFKILKHNLTIHITVPLDVKYIGKSTVLIMYKIAI